MPPDRLTKNVEPAALPRWACVVMQAVGALALICAPILHALGIARESTGFLLGGGIALLLFGALDRLESFSAWGISAKLRQAEEAAREAAASAAEVRALALSVVRLALEQAHAGGRMDGNRRARLLIDRETERLLTSLDASEAERREIFREVNQVQLFDRARAVERAILHASTPETAHAVRAKQRQREGDWSAGLPAPSSAQMRAWAIEDGALDAAVEAALRCLADAEERNARGEALHRGNVCP